MRHRGCAAAALCLSLLASASLAQEWTRVPAGGLVVTSYMFQIHAPADWYRGQAAASNYIAISKGLRDLFVYTGSAAPLPTGNNIQCEVMVLPSSPSQTNVERRVRAVEIYAKELEKTGHRRGQVPVGTNSYPCLLAPGTGRTEYVVLVGIDCAAAVVHVRTPKPGVKFPKAAIRLLEGLSLVPTAATRPPQP